MGEGIVVAAIFMFSLAFIERRMVPSGGEIVRSFGLSVGVVVSHIGLLPL
jgi:hypothetical protein